MPKPMRARPATPPTTPPTIAPTGVEDLDEELLLLELDELDDELSSLSDEAVLVPEEPAAP